MRPPDVVLSSGLDDGSEQRDDQREALQRQLKVCWLVAVSDASQIPGLQGLGHTMLGQPARADACSVGGSVGGCLMLAAQQVGLPSVALMQRHTHSRPTTEEHTLLGKPVWADLTPCRRTSTWHHHLWGILSSYCIAHGCAPSTVCYFLPDPAQLFGDSHSSRMDVCILGARDGRWLRPTSVRVRHCCCCASASANSSGLVH